jgi:hypothetical protein
VVDVTSALAFGHDLNTLERNAVDRELDPAAPPVTEFLGFTISLKGLRVRLRERTPAIARLRLGSAP